MDQVHAYMFEGHWNDLQSIEAFYQANMESIIRPLSIKLAFLLTRLQH